LRSCWFYLFVLFSLTSCVSYYGIHGNSTPLTVSTLLVNHHYTVPARQIALNWWDGFHDPQLSRLIMLALMDSPNMHSAEARVRQAQHLAEGSVAPLLPSLDFSAYFQREKFPQFGLIPPPFNGKIFNISDVGVNFNYNFDIWGKNRQILAATVNEQCATEADLAEARLVISTTVANTYFELLNNIAQVAIAKDNLRQSQQILKIVSERANKGIESAIPVQYALVNMQTARLTVEQFKQAENLARNQLAVLSGKNPLATKISTRDMVYKHYRISLPKSLTANVLARRPDITAAKFRVEAAAHSINAAKAGFFPNFNLTALFSYQSVLQNRLFEVGSQDNFVTGAIDLPIFDAGRRRANLGVKYAEYDLAIGYYNQTILTALREVADQLAILYAINSQIDMQQNVLYATEQNYKLFMLRYHHGIINIMELLEYKQLLLKQQAIYHNLQTRHLQTVVTTLKALGGQVQFRFQPARLFSDLPKS